LRKDDNGDNEFWVEVFAKRNICPDVC